MSHSRTTDLPLAEDLQEEVLQDLEEKLLLSSRPLLPCLQLGRWEPKAA